MKPIINQSTQWAKSLKKQSVGVYQIRTPLDCFFADFAHWDVTILECLESNNYRLAL